MAEDFDDTTEALSYEENYEGGVVFYLEQGGATDKATGGAAPTRAATDKPKRSSRKAAGNLRRCNTEPSRGSPQRMISINVQGKQTDFT